jgi:hypothetical protein
LGFVNDWFGKQMMWTITYIFLMIDQALNLALRHKISELGEKHILCSLHQIGYLPLVLLLKWSQLLMIVACLLDCKRRMDHWITAHRRKNCTCASVWTWVISLHFLLMASSDGGSSSVL